MRFMVCALVALAMGGCGGRVERSSVQDRAGEYVRKDVEALVKTSPGEVAMIAIACDKDGDDFLSGVCIAAPGAAVVESSANLHGQACAFSVDRDGAEATVEIHCFAH
jgi:hypothetical protein